ncbi:MAG: reverse transcriptase family protein, partial [Sedimenticola sp.]
MQGLVTKRLNKLHSPEILELFKMKDILVFTETWTDSLSDITVDNFRHIALHRVCKNINAKRNSGGIIVYVKEYLANDVTLYSEHDDSYIWLKCNGTLFNLTDDLYVCSSYIIPENTSRQAFVECNIFNDILDDISNIQNTTNNECHLMLLGDLNSRCGSLLDYVPLDRADHVDALPDDYTCDTELPRMSQDSVINSNGRLLIDLCRASGLRIVNGRVCNDTGKCTYVGSRGSSMVDFVLVTVPLLQLFSSFNVDDPNILSDHCTVNFTMSCNRQEQENSQNMQMDDNQHIQNVQYKFVWETANINSYKCALNSHETTETIVRLRETLNDTSSSRDIDDTVDRFNNLLNDVCTPLFKKSIKVNPSDNKSYSKKYTLDENSETAKEIFFNNLNKYRQDETPYNRTQLVKSRSDYKQCLRKCKYEQAKSQTTKLLQARLKNAKQYWQLLKETAGMPKSNTISANSFVEYFKAINNPTDHFFQPDEDIIHFNERYFESEIKIMFSELDAEISNEEILRSISQLSNGRSGGPDRFLNEFLVHGKAELTPFLHTLFNTTFQNGYFPDAWSEGYIVPLHKKGNTNDVGNYRGITLLSTIGKLFSRILNNRLTNWAETYYVYVESQAGFRKHMSTVDHVFILHGIITNLINQGKKLYCAFIDFTKAFDYIVRENIWFKLIRIGIRGNMLNVIKSMYENIKSRVKFNNQLSEEFSCMLGVRQGECLSPFIFAMYVNDLEEEFYLNGIEGIDIGMINIFLLLYADDIAILATSQEQLQKGLDTLYNYCQKWKLTVNTKKSKIMIFRKGGRLPANLKFYYNNLEIEIVTKFSYLGVVFTPGGSFSEANNTLSGQAQKAIFKLNKYLQKFTELSPKHVLDLFEKLVVPILNYAGEVWGFNHSNQIERVHLQFCKRLLGVKITTQNDFIYGELGRVSLRIGRFYNIIKYWFKVLQSNDRKYIKCIYNSMLSDIERSPNVK